MSQKPVLLFSFSCVALWCIKSLLNKSAMLRHTSICCLFAGIFSCSENTNETTGSQPPSNDSVFIYPVQQYFYNQVKSIDSNTTITLIQIDTAGNEKSTVINKKEFLELSKPFFENNIADSSVKKYYRESVFLDETTGSYTFNYTSVNNSLPLRTMNVLLDTTNQQVKRIFITQTKTVAGIFITEKIGWKTDQSFFINRMLQLPENKESIQQISVLWQHNN